MKTKRNIIVDIQSKTSVTCIILINKQSDLIITPEGLFLFRVLAIVFIFVCFFLYTKSSFVILVSNRTYVRDKKVSQIIKTSHHDLRID
jgi:hypothetical protein